MKRFIAYRKNISKRETHNEYQKNDDDKPQYEGVIFSDGTVVLRWLTLGGSHSVWNNIEDCLNVHGHPEYGTEIRWLDGDPHPFWVKKIKEYEESDV